MDTTTTVVLLVVLALLVVAALAFLAARRRRRSSLQDRFGPEYDRTVAETDSRRRAERELQERAERRESLDIRPLDPRRREEFATRWRSTQEDFVDRPAEAVSAAQRLVTQVMQERGYPTGDPDQQMKDLSVDHADVLDQYREAHSISQLNDRKQATTEQLRLAMVHYRTLFGRLLDDGAGDGHELRSDRRDRVEPPRGRQADPSSGEGWDTARERH